MLSTEDMSLSSSNVNHDALNRAFSPRKISRELFRRHSQSVQLLSFIVLLILLVSAVMAFQVARWYPHVWSPLFVLGVGIAICLLIFLLIYAFFRVRSYALAVADNLTSRVRSQSRSLRQERDRLEAIFTAMPDVLIATDTHGVITAINKEACDLLSISEESAIGKHYQEVLHLRYESSRKPVPDHVHRVISTGHGITNAATMELKLHRGIRKVALAISPIGSGSPQGVVAALNDVTAEHELLRLKDEMVSLTSHQLKTPIAALKWHCEILSDAKTTLTADHKASLEQIHQTAAHMDMLVETLLNIARIESGRIQVSPAVLVLSKLLKQVKDQHAPLLQQKQQHLKINLEEGLPETISDPKLLSQVLANLVSNAIKYSPEKSTIVIDAKKDGKHIAVQVIDEGSGIPKQEQAQIFQKFYRAKSTSSVPGNGLGLYLVRRIINLLEGEIGFVSSQGVGTTFWFRLPIIRPPAAPTKHTGEKK